MAKRIIHDGPVNTAVMAWMRGQGIDPEDVRGYTLTYNAGDLMTIDLRMFMEDVAPAAEVCMCGERSSDPEMHDATACPIGRADYERTHAADS